MRRRLRAAAPVKVAEIHLREGVPRVELHCAHEAPGRIVEPIELRKRDTEQEIEACRIRAFGQRGAQDGFRLGEPPGTTQRRRLGYAVLVVFFSPVRSQAHAALKHCKVALLSYRPPQRDARDI